MKMTLQEKADMLNIQYILEYLIEHYYKASTESERYKIKLMLFDFIRDTEVCLSTIKNYLSLDRDKFEPFIKALENVVEDTIKSEPKEKQAIRPVNPMMPSSIHIYMRREDE